MVTVSADSQYTFYRTGDYTFQCMGELGMEHSGSFSVVPARYTIALCKDCSRNRQYTINTKDLLWWTIAEMNTNCTVSVTNLEIGHPVYKGLGKTMWLVLLTHKDFSGLRLLH